MQNSTKYYLVDPIKYAAMKAHQNNSETNTNTDIFTHPSVKSVYDIDSKMKTVLEDPSLSEFDKTQMYNTLLEKYLKKFRNALTTSKKESLIGKESEQLKTNEQSTSIHSISEQIVQSVPKSYQTMAKKVLDFIDKSPSLKITENGEVFHDGQPIENSNGIEVINDLVRHKQKKTNPRAYQQVLNILKKEGFQVEILFNRQRQTKKHGLADKPFHLQSPSHSIVNTTSLFQTPSSHPVKANSFLFTPKKRTQTGSGRKRISKLSSEKKRNVMKQWVISHQ